VIILPSWERSKEYKHQVDQMVYELYGLTEDEIRLVEESVKGK